MQLQLQQQKLKTNGLEEEEEEEEEALSLSDLPILGAHHPSDRDDGDRPPEPEDFEFGSWVAEDPLMCSADDVFFQGQILPLRPSVSSDTGILLATCSRPDSQKSSRSGSRSDSMDRSSWGFSSSCSSSSNSNGSSSSTRRPAATGAYGGGFYSHHPSPKPHLGGARIRRSACPSGRGRSSWGLFRLGLVRTPEIELAELRRRSGGGGGGGGGRRGKDENTASNGGDEGAAKFRWSPGLSCKCSPAAVETVSSRILVLRGKKGILEEGKGYNGKREISRRRTFEWLRQLSIAEAPVA
ncbi:hypothetical protein ACLOJK_003671 [Asimina triloba]